MTRQLITFSLLALLSACTSLPPESNREVEVSPRQGEEVKQICFASSINGWREVDGERSSVILTKGVSEEYKLDLSEFVISHMRLIASLLRLVAPHALLVEMT